ncbi:MAG: sulfotransferase [Proteobacteria bacterium]|nr:sulfotransferase [Pseudomonadota bacterium]
MSLASIQDVQWPGTGRKPYDLATSNADYPLRNGMPHRTILICTHPRSGSTLLGEGLYHAGGMGCPIEYFHRGFRPGLALRWGAFDIQSYIQSVYRLRTDTNGVLSVKLFWGDVYDMVNECFPSQFDDFFEGPAESASPAVYLELRKRLETIFPNPAFIYLTRLDRVRQAVSTVIAKQTNLWRSIPGVGEQKPQCETSYDYDEIMYSLSYADFCNAHWKRFFQMTGVPVYNLVYEDIARDYQGSLSGLFKYLGCPRLLAQPVRMRQQSDAKSEKMVLRFLNEYKHRTCKQ